VDTVGLVSVAELVTVEAEEVDVTVGNDEVRAATLDGAVVDGIEPSDVEQAPNNATTATTTRHSNGLARSANVISIPLKPLTWLHRQQGNT